MQAEGLVRSGVLDFLLAKRQSKANEATRTYKHADIGQSSLEGSGDDHDNVADNDGPLAAPTLSDNGG